jgi:hypothetical protein
VRGKANGSSHPGAPVCVPTSCDGINADRRRWLHLCTSAGGRRVGAREYWRHARTPAPTVDGTLAWSQVAGGEDGGYSAARGEDRRTRGRESTGGEKVEAPQRKEDARVWARAQAGGRRKERERRIWITSGGSRRRDHGRWCGNGGACFSCAPYGHGGWWYDNGTRAWRAALYKSMRPRTFGDGVDIGSPTYA